MRWLAGGAVVLACLAFDFNTGGQAKWLAIGLLAAILLVIGGRPSARASTWWSLTKAQASGLALLGWAALSLSWSADWRQGALSSSYALAAFVIFWKAERFRESIGWASVAGILGAIALSVAFKDGGFGNPIFLVEFLIVSLPFAMLTRAGLPVAALVAGFCLFGSTADIELAPIFVVLVLLCLRRPFWQAWSGIVALGSALVFVVWKSDLFRYSVFDRIVLWIDTVRLWLDRPLFGHGLGSFDYGFPQYQEWHASFLWYHRVTLGEHAGAAHSEPLQLLAELGIVGLVLGLVFVWACIHRVNDRLDRACAWSLLLLGSFALVGFPLQNPATVLIGCLSLGLLARHSPAPWWLRLRRRT